MSSEGVTLDDPDYVKWIVRLKYGENQISLNKTELTYHKCTEQDFTEFYPPAKSVENMFELLKSQKQMLCIDSDQKLLINGFDNFKY